MTKFLSTKALALMFLLFAHQNSFALQQHALLDHLKDVKKVSVMRHSEFSSNPTKGLDANRFDEIYTSHKTYSYFSKDKAAVKALIKTLKRHEVRSEKKEHPQLMYVNTLVVFELTNNQKAYFLLGKYYQSDAFVNAELHIAEKRETFLLSKVVHQELRQWVLMYSDVDKEDAFARVSKSCIQYYKTNIQSDQSRAKWLQRLMDEKGRKLGDQLKWAKDRIVANKAELLTCNSFDDKRYRNLMKYRHRLMRMEYFKSNPKQTCSTKAFYRSDSEFCPDGWKPRENNWKK